MPTRKKSAPAKPLRTPSPPPGVDANLLADMMKWAKAAGADSAEAFYINGESLSVAQRLVKCATNIRNADGAFHFEPPSTRVLVTAAKFVAAGATEVEAAEVCILAPLSSDGAITDGLREVAAASLLGSEEPNDRSANATQGGTRK